MTAPAENHHEPGDAPPGGPAGSGWTFGCTGAVLVVGLVLGLFLSVVMYGFSAMCSDDFDTSDCGRAQAAALLPLAFAVAGCVLWGVGWSRRDRPSAGSWVWGGAAVVAVPLLVIVLLMLG